MSVYLTAIRNPLMATVSNHLDGYPTPVNLSYLWGFGSIAGMALVAQIVTGVLLAMHYAPEVHLAFASVEHIMRDVRGGTVLRYVHANGASMFFIIVYVHMFRGLYYGSFYQPRANLWYSGVVLFFLMMATGFMGYVLPWGQMSFWGATVITNLFSAIPYVGNSIVQLLWGGFSVDNPTLNRFFSLHYLLPFLIAAVALLHLILLHQNGSNNPLGINSIYDRIPFYPYFYVKDLFGFMVFVWFFSMFVIYAPNLLGHPDNYIEANPLVTPAHIVPEWYFLPFYAILRTIPDKLGGVVLMALSIVIIALLPVVDTSAFRSNYFKPLNILLFWYFFADSCSLGWIGQEIVESPFIEMANFVTSSYFLYFIPILPFLGFLENSIIEYGVRYFDVQTRQTTSTTHNTKLKSISTMRNLSIASIFNSEIINSMEIDFLYIFINWVHIFQFIIVTFGLLIITIYLPRKVETLVFLHRLGFGYLLLNLWLITLDRTNKPGMNFNVFLNNNELSTVLSLFQEDPFFSHMFFFYGTAIVIAFFYGTLDSFFNKNGDETEFALLVCFIALGTFFLFHVHNLVEFLLAIETVTLASYVCAGYERQNAQSTFASVQYFILGSIPSGMLILGISLLYGYAGVLTFEDLDLLLYETGSIINNNFLNFLYDEWNNFPAIMLNTNEIELITTTNNWSDIPTFSEEKMIILEEALSPRTSILIAALLFIFFNLLFKLTAAPFHFWAPSVYKNAPISSVTYLSIISKAMVIFLLVKIFLTIFYSFTIIITPILFGCAVFTIVIGLTGAFAERFTKAFYVYSSMGHVGFMLVGLGLFTISGFSATFHYLAVYILSSFIMWFVLLYMGRNSIFLISFKELKKSDPIIALMFALLVFSMSGIPPLGGFFIKLDILAALLESSRFGINMLLFLFTVASFFYYLRINKIIFFDEIKTFVKRKNISTERLQLITICFFLLLFYILIVQAPLLIIQSEALATLF